MTHHLALSLVALLTSAALATGCFEAGPLGSTDDAALDTAPGPDTNGPDTVPLADTALLDSITDSSSADAVSNDAGDGATPDVGDLTDGSDGDIATGDAALDGGDAAGDSFGAGPDTFDAVIGPSCLTPADCEGIDSPDPCQWGVACVDYQCQLAADERLLCAETGDPCLVAQCDSGLGECVTSSVCGCTAAGNVGCGDVDYSFLDVGTTNVLAGYACGGDGQALPERIYRFTATTNERIRIEAGGDLYVLPSNETCDAASCLMGGGSAAALDVAAGSSYLFVVEHDSLAASGTLAVACGVTSELSCLDTVDDDGDGATDCDDSDCASDPACAAPVETLCSNSLDDDGDGATDCWDSDCDSDPWCPGTETSCFDNVDNDHDELLDCDDPDCDTTPPCGTPDTEISCVDNADNDGDSLVDCDDPDCVSAPACATEAGACFDDVDNDGDNLIDCADDDCWNEPACLQSCQPSTLLPTCGFGQGASTGGGKAKATDYACGPSYPGKEVVYRFTAQGSGPVTVTMSAAAALGLYVLVDQGEGCTPLHCVGHGPNQVDFTAILGTTYYFVVDGPANMTGSFQIDIDCEF